MAAAAGREGKPFDGTVPITDEHLRQIASHLRRQLQWQFVTAAPEPEQLCGLFQFLDDHYWSARSLNDKKGTATKRPVLLTIGGGGLAAAAAVSLGLASRSVGLDADPDVISESKMMAFRQGVFSKCHLFHVELSVDPVILLDNPHFIADRLNESDVVFVHLSADNVRRSIPLLARLSTKKKGRTFVTSAHHLPDESVAGAQSIPGTELRSYDGVVDRGKREEPSIPPPPEPVDGDDIDREFARSSIRHAMPGRF